MTLFRSVYTFFLWLGLISSLKAIPMVEEECGSVLTATSTREEDQRIHSSQPTDSSRAITSDRALSESPEQSTTLMNTISMAGSVNSATACEEVRVDSPLQEAAVEPFGVFDHTHHVAQVPMEGHHFASETTFFHQKGTVPTELETLSFQKFPSLQERALSTIADLYRKGGTFECSTRAIEGVVSGAQKHLDSVNVRSEWLQKHISATEVPEKEALLKTLSSYHEEFQKIYDSARNSQQQLKEQIFETEISKEEDLIKMNNATAVGYEDALRILKHFATPIRTLQENEREEEALTSPVILGARKLTGLELRCNEKIVEWEQQTLTHLLAEPPEIDQAWKSQRIATCYREAKTSFKNAEEYSMQQATAHAARNYGEAELLTYVGEAASRSGNCLMNQGIALEKAREAKKLDHADVEEAYTQAAAFFKKAGECSMQRAAAHAGGNDVEARDLLYAGSVAEESGNHWMNQGAVLKKRK